jgi:hypothetical protein
VKRLSAILFLAILLFNFYGYRLMLQYMQDRQASLLEAQLDRQQYSEDELISIKTPLHLPYYSSSPDFERAYGSIEVDGITYEYVKRRVHQDTLELLCLPNHGKMQLQSAEREFFKLSLDATAAQNGKKPVTLKISLPDFCQDLPAFSLDALTAAPIKHTAFNTIFLPAGYSSIGEHPPQQLPC